MERNIRKGKQDQQQREIKRLNERSRTGGNTGHAHHQKVRKLKSWPLIPETAERLIGLT